MTKRGTPALHEQAQAAEQRLAPAAGTMLQAVWFDAGADRAGRLLLTIHHFSVDGVSWRILVPDLASAWQAIANGREPALPPRGTSFRRFAQRLAAHAQHPDLTGEVSFWSEMQNAPALSLVDGALDPKRDVAGTAGHLTLTLSSALTSALLTRVPAAFHGGINDVLLTGLALAVADWCRRHERGFERHRPAMQCCWSWKAMAARRCSPDLDLSRTVGWYTSLFPVRLDLGALDLEAALAGGAALGPGAQERQGTAARSAEQRSWLRLAALPQPARRRRSLPATRRRRSASTIWAACRRRRCGGLGLCRRRRCGLAAAIQRCRLAHCIELNAHTLDAAEGAKFLCHLVVCAGLLIGEAAVRDLAQSWFRALEALARHAVQPGAGGRTPSDLPLVALSQAEIERLEAALSADRGCPAAVAAAGGPAVSCAL